MRRSGYLWLLGTLFLLPLPEPLQAQVRAESQVAIGTRYVWRGITRSSRWTVQPQGGFGLKCRGSAFDAGIASIFELGQGQQGDRSEVGVAGSGLGELDLWASGSVYDGATAIRLGVIHYTYHGDASRGGLDRRSNTTELWASLDLRREMFSPRLDLYYDVDRVDGLYLTASGAVPVIAFPFEPYTMMYVEGDVGLNVSQEAHAGRPASGYFDDTGVTHARLALRLPIVQRHNLGWSLAYIAQLGFDRATRAGIDGDPTRGKLTHVAEMRLTYFAQAGTGEP